MPTIITNPYTTAVGLPAPYSRLIPPGAGLTVSDDPPVVDALLGRGHGLRLALVNSVQIPAGDLVTRGPSLGGQTIYADAANGNDSFDGLTPATAVKTFARAHALRGSVWTGSNRTVLLGTTAFTLPANYLLDAGRPIGPTAEPWVIEGGFTDQIGSKTVQSVSANVITVTGGGLTSDALAGATLHCTTAGKTNIYVQIARNDATTITLNWSNTFGIVANDTFEVLRPRAVLDFSTSLRFVGPGVIAIHGVKFTATGTPGSIDSDGHVEVVFDACEMLPGTGQRVSWRFQAVMFCGPFSGQYATLGITDIGSQAGWTGLYLEGLSSAQGLRIIGGARLNGAVVMRKGASASSQLALTQMAAADLFALDIHIGSVSLLERSHLHVNLRGALSSAPSVAVNVVNASVELDAFVIGANGGVGAGAGSHAVSLLLASTADLAAVTGTGNTGNGLKLASGSTARVTSGTTVTGTAGDLLVGATASTWANLGSVTTVAEAASQSMATR